MSRALRLLSSAWALLTAPGVPEAIALFFVLGFVFVAVVLAQLAGA